MTAPLAASPERARWIVWAALNSSVLIYFAIAMSGLVRPAAPLAPAWLPQLMGALAIAAAIAGHLLWRQATGAGLPIHRSGSAAPSLGVALGPRLLLAWALDEAVSVLGLSVALLGHPKEEWFLFFVVSLALLLAHRPVDRSA
jgi:hypothetical protein